MESGDYSSLILYYGRARCFHSMQKTALDGLAKFPTQTPFRLYNGFALALGNRVQEGIRELNPLKNERDLSLGAIHALVHAHKCCSVVDRDAIHNLEQKLKEEWSSNLSVMAAYYAAVFQFLIGRPDLSREYVDKALKLDVQHEPSLVLRAWTELAHRATINGNVLRVFEVALMRGKNIDATLGQVRYFQLKGQYANAINALNKLSVRFPELSIPLIEKMETQFAALDWEHTYETALRIINLEPPNIFALRVKALLLIVRDGSVKEGISTLHTLFAAVERVEVGNHDLLLEISQIFARICSRNRDILSVTIRYVEKLKQISPGNIEFITELGYQRLMIGNIEEASSCFRSATKMDDNYFRALCGLTLCQIMKGGGDDEQVRQQIEYLGELLGGVEREPVLNYLKAKAGVAQGQSHEQVIALLIEATEWHLKKLDALSFGTEYMRLLNPDFMLQLAAELVSCSPIQATVKLSATMLQDTMHISLRHCLTILEVVLRACPAHPSALFMRAKVEFNCGDVTKAAMTLQRLLSDIDPTYTDGHLLLSQMQIQQQQLPKAMQSLEMALSHNFVVRDNPMYHLLLGIIQKQQQQLAEAQKSFISAMQLVGSAYMTGSEQPRERVAPSVDATLGSFSLADKATLYLELIDIFRRVGDAQGTYESERLLQCALEEFSDTAEEGRLVIAHADMLLQNCKVAKAIGLLAAVQPNQSYYIQAKTHLANIYLQQRKDRVAFAKCFKELVAACPEPESYLMLGEAYMSIQEPNLAVEAYQTALSMNPHDSLLASKLGRAYVKTHQYNKAIMYYQEALKSFDHSGLRLDLAELYLKLRQYQSAINVLVNNMEKQINEEDVDALQLRTKELLLLARIYEKSGNIILSLQTLQDARENQYRVQKRISVDQSGSMYEQYKILSKICLQMAQQSISLRDNNEALKCFKECLKFTPQDIELLTSLARLYMQMNSMELCTDVCMQILQIDSSNEAASWLLADLSFRKMEFENAAFHFSQLLMMKPNYWIALARLIEVMRRSGSLGEASAFLLRAEQTTGNTTPSSGLNYCKGLFEWYNGNPNTALRNFASARRDHEWGQQAIFNMIEICINPDGDIPNSGGVQDSSDSGEFNESRGIALRTAERLLKELRPRPGGIDNEALNHRILRNFLQLASKQKFQIETALQDFADLANEYQNMIGPVLGMASAFVQLKQTQRAKNHLKRIARVVWNFEEAEYLERSWLLLADIYIHANKNEVAETLCDRVLEHNKSCAKAYELKGHVSEKLQQYKEAAKHFNHAWNYGGRSKPNIGYKLAYNHMKTKRYADAIDVCQQVVKLHPDYTVIRKDILEKCRNNLRP